MIIETELVAPMFLVAVPQLGDAHFQRGVVLILEHGERGSMGLLINKPSTLAMGPFCSTQQMAFKGDTKALVHHGGPVQTDRAFILHASEHEGPETEHVVGDIRLSYSLESLKLLVDDPPESMRVFLGYSGWGPGQLAEEITSGAWLLASPDKKLLFGGSPETMWERVLQGMGIEPVQLVHSGVMH